MMLEPLPLRPDTSSSSLFDAVIVPLKLSILGFFFKLGICNFDDDFGLGRTTQALVLRQIIGSTSAVTRSFRIASLT